MQHVKKQNKGNRFSSKSSLLDDFNSNDNEKYLIFFLLSPKVMWNALFENKIYPRLDFEHRPLKLFCRVTLIDYRDNWTVYGNTGFIRTPF